MPYADSLTDLAEKNKIDPALGTFDESKGVAGRVQSITSSGSPLMQTARTRAAQQSASRGLLNSSIGAQAGEQAVIETATPIANADAGLYQQQGLANQSAKNAAATQNANNKLTAGVQGSQLDVSQDQASKSLMEQARQFGVSSGMQQQQIDNQRTQASASLTEGARQFDSSRKDNAAMFDRELSEKARQFGLTQDQQIALANLDVNTKVKLAEIEASYKKSIQSSANISNAWGTMMEGIAAIQTNPNLDENTKAALINNNLASFSAFSNFWRKATAARPMCRTC